MKVKTDYILRQVMEYYVVIGVGEAVYVPNEIMSLNETGAFLWRLLEKGTDEKELTDSIVHEYDVNNEIASSDVAAFLDELRKKDLIEE